MRFFSLIVVLACTMAAGYDQGGALAKPSLPGSPVQLLPGYRYVPLPGVDTSGGKIVATTDLILTT
jgi:hypothetical protein